MDNKTNTNDDLKNVNAKHKKRKDNSKYYNNNMPTRIILSQRVIDRLLNHLNTQELMATVGYDQTKVKEFELVYQAALKIVTSQQFIQAEMHDAYRLFLIDFNSAQLELRYLLKVIRVALRDDLQKIETLQLNTKKGKSKADSFTFMDSFYNQLLADAVILDKLARYGYPKERVLSCFEIVLAAKTGYGNYIKAKAISTEATRNQKLKIAELDKWMSEYNTLLKVAEAQKLLVTKQV